MTCEIQTQHYRVILGEGIAQQKEIQEMFVMCNKRFLLT